MMNTSPSNFSPMAILDKARKAVPAVNYALGVAGIAAAAAIISWLVGKNNSGIILLSSSFVGMILLFIFSKLVVSTAPSVQFAGIVLVWIILLFFATFLLFTTTAFVLGVPCNWAELLGVANKCSVSAAQRRVEPIYTAYSSPELGVTVIFPNNIFTLDTTERMQRKLVLRDADGLSTVRISRAAILEQKDVRLARDNEVRDLRRLNLSVTYIAPENEKNWSNWYVLSGVNHGTEFYYRRWYCDDGIVSIEFSYGKEFAPLFDILIPKMAHDLTMNNCGRYER